MEFMPDALSQSCEAEKLHLSGAIQAWGALLRVDTAGVVSHASANLHEFIGLAPQEMLGRPAAEVLPWLNRATLAQLPEGKGRSFTIGGVFELPGRRIDAHIVNGGDHLLVELEMAGGEVEPVSLHAHQRKLLAVPGNEPELAAYHDILLKAFRDITGFDRLMIYRFHDDWSGEVIAENTTPALGSYLGLRFPASDIPGIARNLYLLNACRCIPDSGAGPVSVLSLTGEPPDLTWTDLRSVSTVHLEYLANMGVGASFSVPIRVAGRLWGLVACHHLTPRRLTSVQRSVCVSLTGTYALGLSSSFSSRRLQLIDSLERRVDSLLESIASNPDPLAGIESNGAPLTRLLDAEGFAMAIGEDVVLFGRSPDLPQMGVIDHWFLGLQESLFSTHCLGRLLPGDPALAATTSGLMAIKSLSGSRGWVRFYWFRPEALQEVAWAGNPNKPVVENAGAARLSPRRSFERWVEVTSGCSRPWSNEERMVAARFRNSLLKWL